MRDQQNFGRGNKHDFAALKNLFNGVFLRQPLIKDPKHNDSNHCEAQNTKFSSNRGVGRGGRVYFRRFCKNQYQFAFTLAEILITLSIIGIIAALTIPSLIVSNQKKETIVKLQKVYNALSNAVALSESEYGNVLSWEYPTSTGSAAQAKVFFDKYLRHYLNITRECYMSEGCSPKYTVGVNGQIRQTDFRNSDSYILNDGTSISLSTSNLSGTPGGRFTILIYLKGTKEKQSLTKDIFTASIISRRDEYWERTGFGLDGIGQEREKILNGEYGCKTYGAACGALIQHDGWQIKDDYPW